MTTNEVHTKVLAGIMEVLQEVLPAKTDAKQVRAYEAKIRQHLRLYVSELTALAEEAKTSYQETAAANAKHALRNEYEVLGRERGRLQEEHARALEVAEGIQEEAEHDIYVATAFRTLVREAIKVVKE